MNAIEKILLEQDIDLGVGKDYFESDLTTANRKVFEKNLFNEFSQTFFLNHNFEEEKVFLKWSR
jgi:hypothetical protein